MEEVMTKHPGTDRLLKAISSAEDVIDPSRAQEMDDQVRRTSNATFAALKRTGDADVALWFGGTSIAWQTKQNTGLARDLDQCFEDIRLTLIHEDVRPGVPLHLDRTAQDRIIAHERAAGRGEPKVGP